MSILRVLRVLITSLLILALLAAGSVALFTYSTNKVVFRSEYFSKDLLYSGTYHEIYNYVIATFISAENTDNMEEKAYRSVEDNIIQSIQPMTFAYIASDYLANWMKYMLAEVPESDIPLLNLQMYKDEFFSSAAALTRNSDFSMALLEQKLQSYGDSTSNYTSEELEEMIDNQIKEEYSQDVENVFNSPSSLYYQTVVAKNPLAVLKFAAPELSEDELMLEIKRHYGILDRLKSTIKLFYIGIIVCLGLIVIMWIKKLNIALLIDGIVIILSALPLFVVSISEKFFIRFIAAVSTRLPASIPDITNFEFYNNLAIKPLINQTLIVSGLTMAAGFIFILFSVLTIPEKKNKKIRPDIEIS